MKKIKANIVAVNMGYGHQRAAYPLKDLSGGKVINANDYQGISSRERASWQTQTGLYENISVLKKVPLLGPAVFGAMDRLQDIAPFYPKRPLPRRTTQQLFFHNKVRQGLGKKLISELNRTGAPLIATFPVPVYFAEYWGFKNQIYCVVCDADISRFWAPFSPDKSRAIYLAPTARVAKRLAMYGVNPKQIILTGFPLPKDNIGGQNKPILKADLGNRLKRLTGGDFEKLWGDETRHELGVDFKTKKSAPVNLMFAVGGAGAQTELAIKLLNQLTDSIRLKRCRLTLVAGVREDARQTFDKAIKATGLKTGVSVIFAPDKDSYFEEFNAALRTTDVLITKPSELSFYAALGLPIIMTEPVGAQELANRDWLLNIGAGIDALDWNYCGDWLFDWLESGRLARAAWLGYKQAEAMGTYNIEKIIKTAQKSKLTKPTAKI